MIKAFGLAMHSHYQPWTLTARWLFPVAGPPLEQGTITVKGDRIVDVEARGNRTADIDLGNVAIVPGLVNAHTHLDLSGMRGLAPPTPDFVGWLRQVIAHRSIQSPEECLTDIRAGLAQSLSSGTTLIGDISSNGTSWEVLREAPLRAVVFREMIGLTAERASRAWADQDRWVEGHPTTATCRPGVSPHAPYSVRSSLFLAASTSGVPAAIHLAESAAEAELLVLRRGPFVPFLKDMGVWDPEGLAEDYMHVLGLSNGLYPILFIHCNYLPSDTRIPDNASIIYCPRTHAAFGHPIHPFREFLARGIRVALGTDSLASNPDLDILAEARFLHSTHLDVPGATVLRMATLSGAEALGFADVTGSLESGKSADLVVVPLPDVDCADPHDLLLESALPVQSVLFRGRWVQALP